MPEPRAKKSKCIFLFIRVVVVVCGVILGVFWVSREQRWNKLVEIFRQMNIGVFAAALGIFIVSQIAIGLRWWLLLRSQRILIDFWAAVRLYFLGWFYNNFMPGSVGGDLLRAWYVTKHTPKKFEAVLSVFVDRVIGLLSTLAIAVFFYLLFLQGRGAVIPSSDRRSFLEYVVEYKGVLLLVFAAIVAIFCVLLLHKASRSILVRAWLYIRSSTLRIIAKLKDAIVIYCSKPGIILLVFGLTVLLQLLTITGFWLLGKNLGIEAGIEYYYVFFTLAWVLGAIPVSIGGVVVVEVLLVSMFINFAGVGEEPASALALCQRAVWMLASLPGAAIHLIGAHLPKDFFIDCKKSIN
ncbi:MAG: lysylphosphatidylglycerol synthase transmembrane domain-containing protein [Planctomycetota bacterium]